jgi:hypothetical protein
MSGCGQQLSHSELLLTIHWSLQQQLDTHMGSCLPNSTGHGTSPLYQVWLCIYSKDLLLEINNQWAKYSSTSNKTLEHQYLSTISQKNLHLFQRLITHSIQSSWIINHGGLRPSELFFCFLCCSINLTTITWSTIRESQRNFLITVLIPNAAHYQQNILWTESNMFWRHLHIIVWNYTMISLKNPASNEKGENLNR